MGHGKLSKARKAADKIYRAVCKDRLHCKPPYKEHRKWEKRQRRWIRAVGQFGTASRAAYYGYKHPGPEPMSRHRNRG